MEKLMKQKETIFKCKIKYKGIDKFGINKFILLDGDDLTEHVRKEEQEKILLPCHYNLDGKRIYTFENVHDINLRKGCIYNTKMLPQYYEYDNKELKIKKLGFYLILRSSQKVRIDERIFEKIA